MIIAEFIFDHPILHETLTRVPDIEAVWEETYKQPDGPTQMVFWVDTDDFAAVDAALDDDPSVRHPTMLTETNSRRLYRVDFTSVSCETDILPEVINVGAFLQEVIGRNDGWHGRITSPDREALEHIYLFCCDHDIEFTITQLYEETSWVRREDPGLTEAQREILSEAVDSGYLAIPRECSLAELGDRLGISETAASERLRRAVQTLIEQSISP